MELLLNTYEYLCCYSYIYIYIYIYIYREGEGGERKRTRERFGKASFFRIYQPPQDYLMSKPSLKERQKERKGLIDR